ncbi:MAG TPA: SpoIIE family protein phosphatase [Candidatus Binatia bacterium]|nr:SpoIIE family protein phosphatase [Candidatus Binatia bacterium]
MNPAADKPTILIAEDHEHVREALAMLLGGQGYTVVQCVSPGEALLAAREREPDLAILDMNYQRDSTSGLEGLELIRRLRELDGTIPVIALTAWGNVDLAVSAMKHGASDFIEKPWRNDALLEKTRSLIGRVREMRSSQRVSDYERHDAHQLHTRIVPQRHVEAQGVEIFGDSVPAGIVGGDYFGVWEPTADTLHFCVADVSGKGTPGALIAAMLYASVSTLSSGSNRPEIILAQVETTLRNQLGEGHYVTIFYGVLELRTRVLHYVNAGHCPPILRRRNGTLEWLAPTRPVLGLMLHADFRAERLALGAGDRLLLYTDGVSEAANEAGEEFGAERLAAMAAGAADEPLAQCYAEIMECVRRHACGRFSDDATLLLLTVAEHSYAAAGNSAGQMRSSA